MAICIMCGKETASCLCDDCRAGTDPEKLCMDIITYRPGSGENLLWENMIGGMYNPNNFRNLVFFLSDVLPTPRKEFLRVLALAGESANIPKASRPWFYEIYEDLKDSCGLNEAEKNRLRGIAVGAYSMDYDYEKAENTASLLCTSEDIPWQAFCSLAEFYTNTRRYDFADELMEDARTRFGDVEAAVQAIQNRMEKNTAQRKKAETGKQEYLPNPRENKETARQKYIDFLAMIGIDAAMPASPAKVKNVIPRDQYPEPVETRESSFDTFVAFDLETTGRSPRIDSIIEIGAVKVMGGQIVETAEFIFQELVQPLDHKKVSSGITELTGITNEEAYAARPIWEVFPDFMRFAGDAVLLGFNCMQFDSRFMIRAGRYSNLIIHNKYFDVMRYAVSFKEQLGIDSQKASLETLADALDIENPRAHRALADAVTTAKIFLKLKEMESGDENISVDDLLADLEDW